MKKQWILLILGVFMASSLVHANGLEWLTDFEKAKQLAAEKNRPILINFSGSDWCVWCKRLAVEVFNKKAFEVYAKDELVLFVADFPRTKRLPDEMRKQNEALMGKYGIRGLPTILLLDAKGEVLAQTGYRQGGADIYVEHLKQLLEQSRKMKSEKK